MRTESIAFGGLLVVSFCLGHFIAGASARAAASPAAVLATDDGVFRFLINGKQVAYIDRDGLNVRGDIAYSGATFDYGAAEFDKRTDLGHAR